MLYAALYHIKTGRWPVRLEVVPLHGEPVELTYNPKDAECLLAEANRLLRTANARIGEVEGGRANITGLANPRASTCRFCLFRPACQAYWLARELDPHAKWPSDVTGVIKAMTHLRNGKVCLRLAKGDSASSPCITVRNLTDTTERHPLLQEGLVGTRVSLYGLDYDYRTGDYTETATTVIYVTN